MSDEEDYMSLKFLEEAQDFEKNKTESYSERRKRQLREQSKKAYIKPLREREEEEREKGLKNSVDTNNKGMQMLMKMGFKKGDALGKGGITEPIQVDLKSNRLGIGMENEMKKRIREAEEELENKKAHIDVDDFRVAKARIIEENKKVRYIHAAASVCQTLDEQSEVKSNILWELKPKPESDPENDDEEKEVKTTEDVEEADLGKVGELDHLKNEQNPYTKEEVDSLMMLPTEEKLERVNGYLREKHSYCFWCRAKYDNKQDLDENCPGKEEDDH